jgi:hypothetical protein
MRPPRPEAPAGGAEIGGGGLAALHAHLEAHLLAFVQARQTGGLHGGDVHEHVLAALVGDDEPIPLGGVEPLHSASGHAALLCC